MTGWQVDPAGVRAVLSDVESRAGSLSTVITSGGVQQVLGGLSWGGQITAAVPAAVGLLVSDQQRELQDVANRVTAGLVGVGSAVVALRDGADQMTQVEDQMLSSVSTGDVSWFQAHGYLG